MVTTRYSALGFARAALLVVGAAALASEDSAASAAPELLWETGGFKAPESVVLDAERDVFYVSNMGTWGKGQEPRDGFISRVGADGTLLEASWIGDLENPKGLALVGGRLFVGDDDALVEIDVVAGSIVARHAPAGGPAEFNDCTADATGRVYVFSSRLSTVFRLENGILEPWAEFDRQGIGYINGLLATDERLLLGSWAVRGADGIERLGHLSTIDFATRTRGRLGSEPIANIDGIEADGLGGYTVTDWVTGAVLRVSAEGRPELLMTLPQGVADHTHVIARQLLVFPLVKDHTLRAYRWVP